jgi:spectinomycin phosphotransferase
MNSCRVISRLLADHVRVHYGLRLAATTPVAGGEDSEATVLKATTTDGASFALRLSRRPNVLGLLAQDRLARSGVAGIPAPRESRSGRPWSQLRRTWVSITAWIAGRRGVDSAMSQKHWKSFGALLAAVHASEPASSVSDQLPREDHAAATVAAAAVADLASRLPPMTDTSADAVALELAHTWSAAAARINVLSSRPVDHEPSDCLLTAYHVLGFRSPDQLTRRGSRLIAHRQRGFLLAVSGPASIAGYSWCRS